MKNQSWEMVRLGEIVRISKGKKYVEVPFEQARYRYINIDDLHGGGNLKYTNDEGVKVSEHDVLIAWDGANAGKVGVGLNGVIGSTLAKLELQDNQVNSKYLYWLLDSKFDEIKSTRTGATIPHVNGQALKSILIPLPPLPTQRAIAERLDRADALRQKDRQLLQEYDALAEAVFVEMFGDPVKNEKGWEVSNLGRFTRLVSSGSTPLGGAKVYQDHGIPFIRSQNVLMGSLDFSDITFISIDIHNQMKRTWVKNMDVLLNITGASIGRVAVYSGGDDKANVNQHVCIIRTERSAINPYYLSSLISQKSFQVKTIGSSSGGTREAFNFQQIKNFQIPSPPLALQNRFAAILANIEQQKALVRQQLAESEALFGRLLQEAFE